MAGIYSITTEAEEAATTAAETILALVGVATKRAKIVEWSIAFDSTSPTAEPVRVRLVRITADDGTRSTTVSEEAWDPAEPAAGCVGRHSYTAEPTKAATPIFETLVHPQGGIFVQYPLGREIVLAADATDGVAIEVLAPAGVNCTAHIAWEE